MSTQDQLVSKRSPSQQQYPSYLLDKHKLDEKLPIILPTIITHKNTYFSLSEQFRHTKKIDAIQKLQYVISFNPEQELTLLKEFLNKIGVFDDKYHQKKYLSKLSKFIHNYSAIDPNKSLYEIIMTVLRNESDDTLSSWNASPKKKSIALNAANKEMLYISPLKFLNKKKAKCVRLRESHSQKEILNHKLFLKRDMYELMNLERQARISLNNRMIGEQLKRGENDSLTEINNEIKDSSEHFIPNEAKLKFDSENNNEHEPIKKFTITENTLKYNDSFWVDAKKFLFFSRKIDVNFSKGKEENNEKNKNDLLEKSQKSNDAYIYQSLKLHQNLDDYKVFPVYQNDYYTPRGIDSVMERLTNKNNNDSVKKKLATFISLEKQMSKGTFNRLKYAEAK